MAKEASWTACQGRRDEAEEARALREKVERRGSQGEVAGKGPRAPQGLRPQPRRQDHGVRAAAVAAVGGCQSSVEDRRASMVLGRPS